jgi:hypothetical protein
MLARTVAGMIYGFAPVNRKGEREEKWKMRILFIWYQKKELSTSCRRGNSANGFDF